MKLVKCFIIFALNLTYVIGLNTEIQIILDVVKSYDKPTAVVAKVCWGLSDKMSLVDELMNTDSARTIQFTDKFKSIEKFAAEDMIIILDLHCQDGEQFLEEANKSDKFDKPHRWMLFSTEKNTNVIPSQLKTLSIPVGSEVIIVNKMENDTTLLNKVYKIDNVSDFSKEAFGIWSVSNGLNIFKEAKVAVSIRRKNLKGKNIVMSVVIVDDSTKTNIFSLKDFVTDNAAKVTFHNILPLYDFINATLELTFTDTWGYFMNNSWSGMIGQIMSGNADLCGTVLLMRLNRMDKISFLTQPIHSTVKFVFREPPLSLQNNLFILPFKASVWMCIGALVVVLVFIIYVTAKWETAKKNGTNCDDPTILKPDISDIAFFVTGAVVQQGSNSQLKGSLGRVVMFIMFLMFLFLYTSYSANIVALLQSSSDQIQTLSDLLNSKLELGVEDQPYTRHYFSTLTDPVRKAIYDTKVAPTGYKPNFMSIEEGVKKLRNMDTPFAFHMNLGIGYRFVEQYFHEHEKCGLREIEYIPNASPWLCCRKQSPYREIYKIGLARILEHGIGDRVNRLVHTRKPPCNTRGSSFGSVNMVDFHPVLLCLLYGMVASLMLLVLEILIFRRQQRQMSMPLRSSRSTDFEDSDTWRLD